eukprot:jgi/Ulvmu1/5934/UM026_0056.1
MQNPTDLATGEHRLDRLPSDLSIGQIAACLAFGTVFIVYAYSTALRLRQFCIRGGRIDGVNGHCDIDCYPSAEDVDTATLPTKAAAPDLPASDTDVKDQPLHAHVIMSLLSSPLFRVLSLNGTAVRYHHDTISALAEFSAWMIWFFLSDRTRLLEAGVKSYSRDVFLTAFATIIAIAFGSSVRPEKRMMILSRQQTEEWKGWMQVMFLLYHYFEAREAYNAIRVLIAGYVWMTGYGNFHYYYRTNDFCIGRFAQMMWRLNFLVIVCCIVLRNDYMLYYICPMHTAFTVLVYVALGIARHLNHSRLGMALKLAACVAMVTIVWDIPAVFYAMWRPLRFLVGYIDPRNPNTDPLHEWHFRSSLDRFVWIWGMVVAWMHPHMESVLALIDGMRFAIRNMCRLAILLAAVGLLYIWYINVYTLEKLEYNELHPFTSWVPITVWIVIRNLTPQLRQHSLGFLGWLGCITLETYISQFHIWLRSIIPNGQPKFILDLVPGYPLFNFFLTSILYIGVSYRLFALTNILKVQFVPHDDDRLLGRNVILMGVCAGALYSSAAVIHSFIYQSF